MNRLAFQPDVSNYTRAEQAAPAVQHNPPPVTELPGFSSMSLGPLPLLSGTSDGLRQYYRSGSPQYRVIAPGRAIFQPLT